MNKHDKLEYQAVIERSGGVCELTGKTPICIHHVIYRSHGGMNDRRNMIALSPDEHIIVHQDEKHWTPILLEKMHEYYGDFDISELKKKNKWHKLGGE